MHDLIALVNPAEDKEEAAWSRFDRDLLEATGRQPYSLDLIANAVHAHPMATRLSRAQDAQLALALKGVYRADTLSQLLAMAHLLLAKEGVDYAA